MSYARRPSYTASFDKPIGIHALIDPLLHAMGYNPRKKSVVVEGDDSQIPTYYVRGEGNVASRQARQTGMPELVQNAPITFMLEPRRASAKQIAQQYEAVNPQFRLYTVTVNDDEVELTPEKLAQQVAQVVHELGGRSQRIVMRPKRKVA